MRPMRLKPEPAPREEAGAAPLIEARGLTVRAGRRVLINRIDMAVGPGEIVTLIGPNGAGKTTLVRALLGIVAPAEGTVSRREGLRVGYVPQRFEVDGALPLTVERLLSLAHRAAPGEIAAALTETGVEHLAGQALSGLSGGELRRVLLARTLLKAPDLLILDEPDQGVDVVGQTGLFETISRIRANRGCGVLLISHDLHLVMSATDRVICLNGHVCCSGHPEHVVKDPAYIELFGARAASGLAVYTHEHDHAHGDPAVEGDFADGD